MGDGLDRERLRFVGRGQAEVLRALAGELVSELVHATAVGHVHEHAEPVPRDPFAVCDQPGAIVEPDGSSILGDDAVLDPTRRAAGSLGRVEPVPVVGMDDPVPELGVGVPLLGRVAEDRRGLFADRDRLLRTVDRVEVGDRRHLFLQRAEPLFRLHPPRGGLTGPSLARVAHGLDLLELDPSSLRDVDDQATKPGLRTNGRGRELADVPEPRLTAVLRREAILDVEPLALGRFGPGIDDSVPVVRMHALEPGTRILDPLARRVAEQVRDGVRDGGELPRLRPRLPDDRMSRRRARRGHGEALRRVAVVAPSGSVCEMARRMPIRRMAEARCPDRSSRGDGATIRPGVAAGDQHPVGR